MNKIELQIQYTLMLEQEIKITILEVEQESLIKTNIEKY